MFARWSEQFHNNVELKILIRRDQKIAWSMQSTKNRHGLATKRKPLFLVLLLNNQFTTQTK